MKTIFENNGGSYSQQGNYLLPNLTLSDGIEKQIGVGGIRHKRYLKSNHRVLYYNLLTSSKLDNYLADVEERAKNLFEQTVKSLAEKEQVTEKLKAMNMMLWVQKMNNIRNRASCLARNAIVYVFPHPVAPKYVPPFPVCSITDFIILCLSSLTAKNCG